MSPSGETTSSTDSPGRGNNASGPIRNPPLVIVSERGRHSEASRRIVRAQAARASAAQSRETRARNREDRHARDGPRGSSEGVSSSTPRPQPPNRYSSSQLQHYQQAQQPYQQQQQQQQQQHQQPYQRQQQQQAENRVQYQYQHQHQQPRTKQEELDSDGVLAPLVNWVTNILKLTAASFVAGAAALATAGRPPLGNASQSGYIADSGLKMEEVHVTGGIFSRQLPIALPRGFATLQSRISISEGFMVILSRTACFDYASSGVENRLNELIFDIVMNTAADKIMDGTDGPEHPIQKHLRLACLCLTIFQGQRADGATFAGNQNYDLGLQAAWDEALDLDQDALKDQKSAEAALWAVFVISVTCGTSVKFFHHLLWSLMQDLQLAQWNEVRNVLLDFIYPGSFIDAPMQQFYYQLAAEAAG